ncbi:MAG: hypothetical protein H6732_03600 [Alphaproteobacteria bacterium]|nr:hypothetical protein [Alphaproteobacteria bacterium]
MARAIDAGGRAVGGTLPHAVQAVVRAVDDPAGLGRVRVAFPTLEELPESGWLRVALPGAGDGCGLLALPEPGDEVVVLFLYGGLDAGVVVGGLHHEGRPVPEEARALPSPERTRVAGLERSTAVPTAGSRGAEGNDRRLWRSRAGHVIAFDDTEGAESVQVWDASGRLGLVLDSATGSVWVCAGDGDLHLRAAGDLHLGAGGDVVVEAKGAVEVQAGGDLALEAGAEARVSARGRLALEAGASASLGADGDVVVDAGARLTLRGRITHVDGAGTCRVTGGALVEVRAGTITLN